MIGKLYGKVEYRDSHQAIIRAGDVGYKISAPIQTLEQLAVGDEVDLWTYLAVRETALDLYAFVNKKELSVFELLLTVSGIGPKTALGILSVADIRALEQAVITGDTSHLTRVAGIGKKNADKIVLELKNKLVAETVDGDYSVSEEVDVIEALRSLGYSSREAQEALKKVPKGTAGATEKIKAALKHLGNH